MNRPVKYTIVAILAVLLGLFDIVQALPALFQGPGAVEQAGTNAPYVIYVMGFGTGLLGLVAAYGVWRVQKWGVVLTILLRAVDSLQALLGIVGAPTAQLKITASVRLVISIVMIVALLWPKSRLASVES